MSKRRRFSIVIPAYENETFLNRALNSIADQDYKDIEIIVSDDCSKQANLKKVCDEFKKKNFEIDIHYFYQGKNLSPTPNVIFLLKKAKGDFIMIFPHDDFLADDNFFDECEILIKNDPEITCIIGNSIMENTKKKMVEGLSNEWELVKNKENFIFDFSNTKNHPAYSAVFFKREVLVKNGYFDLFFNLSDYAKFKYEPDEIMMAPLLCTFYGKAIVSGKVVSVRGVNSNNYSTSDFWEKTYRVSVAMPLIKLYFYFKNRNRRIANHFLKLAVFKYCFVPLNLTTIIYFKNVNIAILMILSNLYFKISLIRKANFILIRGVNFFLKKIFDIDYILKK